MAVRKKSSRGRRKFFCVRACSGSIILLPVEYHVHVLGFLWHKNKLPLPLLSKNMVESSDDESDVSDAQSPPADDASATRSWNNDRQRRNNSTSRSRRSNDDDGASMSGSRSSQPPGRLRDEVNGGGSKSASGRVGGKSTSKRLLEDSPASTAGTGSTCSLSTTASHGFGLGGTAGISGGGTDAALGGGSVAVGTLPTSSGHASSGGRSRMDLGTRNGKIRNRLSRQERRAHRRRQRRVDRNHRRNRTPAAVLRQLQTMSATLGVSFGLFLLFYLNLPALLFLMATLAIGALTAMIGYQYLILQYNAIIASGGFIQFLPEGVQASLRDALSGTTLHEWMTDPAFFMEYRYLALYFIPGLDADQLDGLVDRLPERHRQVLRRPGYMSSMTPASVRRVLIADRGENDRGVGNNAAALPTSPAPSSSSGSGDGNIELSDTTRRQLFDNEEDEIGDENADNGDAQYEPSTTELWADIAATITSVVQGSAVGQAALSAIQEEEDVGDSSSADSIVIERLPSDDASGNHDEFIGARFDGGSIPPTVTTMATQRDLPQTPAPLQSAEEEQMIEGDILNDAAAIMSRNYFNAAAEAAASTARNVFFGAVEFLTPGIVGFGLGTSVFSGFGLIGSYYVNFVRGHPLVWRRSLPRLLGDDPLGGGTSSGNGDNERETMSTSARYVMYGLTTSAIMGTVSAGFMLLLRSAVRRSIAAERARNEDKKGTTTRRKSDESDT